MENEALSSENRKLISGLQGPILVLGASGFIGANLVRQVAEVRPDILAGVRRDTNWRIDDLKDKVDFVQADMSDTSALLDLIRTRGVQTIFHAVSYGAYSFEVDAGVIDATNYIYLNNLLRGLIDVPINWRRVMESIMTVQALLLERTEKQEMSLKEFPIR